VPGFFQDKEIELLEEAAVDISFALDNLAREEDRRQARAQAEREKKFSDTMIESMPGVLYFYDRNGRFLRWNRNFETVSGYSSDEIARIHPLDFFAHDDRILLQERIAEVFEKGESAIEAPLLARDGTSTPFFFTGKQVSYDDISCLVGVGIDVSDRKEAELALQKSEHRYRSTLDNILEACQIIDFEWRYLYLNRAAAQQNRRPNDELLGQRMQEAWPGIEKSDIYQWMLRCLEERVSFHEESEFIFPDGSSGWFDLRIEPVPEGIFLLSIEITERHHAEAALRELNGSLEQKIAERTIELQSALVRAEAADRIKSAFLATMSHELRTPLNSIIGFTGIILQELPGPLNPEQRKQLGMVRSSARHLLELINDVLDLSKIEAGQLDIFPENFDMAPVVERVVETLKPQAKAKGVKLIAELNGGHLTLRSDRRRVEQILLNLINNAIKFTEEGTVTLRAGLDPPGKEGDPAALRIIIRDTGIGIRDEDLGGLFQPFHQIDQGLTRRHEGTGLGLAICRRLIDLLGGEITVTSEWEQGSTFTVHLPLTSPGLS
jgi:PAS domain S-box-containing protein